jgi:hypothetical protein
MASVPEDEKAGVEGEWNECEVLVEEGRVKMEGSREDEGVGVKIVERAGEGRPIDVAERPACRSKSDARKLESQEVKHRSAKVLT